MLQGLGVTRHMTANSAAVHTRAVHALNAGQLTAEYKGKSSELWFVCLHTHT